MSGFESHYSPGAWVAVTAESAWMLIDLPLTADKLARAYTALRTAGADAVLDILLKDGLAALAPFALVAAEPEGVRVVVRRPCTVVLDGETIEASSATWTDRIRPYPVESISLVVEGEPQSSVALPMSIGISQASALTLTAAAAEPPARTPEVVTDPALDVELKAVPFPEADVEAEPKVEPEPAAEDAPDAQPEVAPEMAAEPEVEPEMTVEPEPGTDPVVVDVEPAPALDPEGPIGVDYADLFAGTTSRNALLERLAAEEQQAGPAALDARTEEAETTTVLDDDQIHDGSHTATWNDIDPLPEPPASPPPTAPSETGLIDGLPWETGARPAPPASPPAAPAASSPPPLSFAPPLGASADEVRSTAPREPDPLTDDLDEIEVRTMSRSELLASLQSAGHVGPTVLAISCPAGHITSPYLERCRVCDAVVDTSTPREISRPTLGVLVLPTGEKVTLDRDVILGRAPHAKQVDAATKPHEIKLADPGVSRSHVQITLNGWDVVARDLGSSNGTELVLPGGKPLKLRPDEDYLVEPGSSIVLAEDVTLTFMVST